MNSIDNLILRYGDVLLHVVAVLVERRHRAPVAHLTDDEDLRDEFHGPQTEGATQHHHVDLVGAERSGDVENVIE